ncbi:hypothetical protein OAA06_02090 [bacterium]|nr:hypothetical protein [bacterium]
MKINIFKLLVCLYFVVTLNIGCKQNSLSPIDELKILGKKMGELNHIDYSYKLDGYTSYSGKWPRIKGRMYFEKDEKDSIIGMKYYNISKHFECFYNEEFVVVMNKPDSSIFKSNLVLSEDAKPPLFRDLEMSFCAIKLFLTAPNISTEIDSLIKRDTIIGSKASTYYSFWANERFISVVKAFNKFNMKVELIFNNSNSLPIYYSQKNYIKYNNT